MDFFFTGNETKQGSVKIVTRRECYGSPKYEPVSLISAKKKNVKNVKTYFHSNVTLRSIFTNVKNAWSIFVVALVVYL